MSQALVGKIVSLKWLIEQSPASLQLPDRGRVLKFFKADNRILIANEECQTIDDVSSKAADAKVFRWGKWVDLSDVEITEESNG